MLWDNLFLSAFYHWNEVHLFTNMTTLLWTGGPLETDMGSAEFASMVAILLGLSAGIAALLSQCLSFLGDDIAYFDQHSVGFSGVLFGMKAVLGTLPDRFVWIPGMTIPAKYAGWAELFLTQALVPNSSFLGHLGGLLAGYVYIWLKRSLKGRDPLTLLISGGARVVTSQVRFAQKLLTSVLPQGHKTGGGRVGCHSSARECPPGLWRCSTCTNYNSLATDVCETCSTTREDCALPRGQDHQAGRNGELSVEEMRRRRLDRLDR
jgi:rhomboid domain-containing protein 1